MDRTTGWIGSYLDYLCIRLSSLPEHYQIVFAICCCERIYPTYKALTSFLKRDDHIALESILDRLWEHPSNQKATQEELIAMLTACEHLPLGDEGCCIHRKPSIDVLGAVWIALESCNDDTTVNVAKVAECAINLVDGQIMAQVWELYDRPIGPALDHRR